MIATPSIEAHGARIPVLGLGTFPLSGDTCIEVVTQALRLGYRHIDTAAMYGNERDVGQALKASGVQRAQVFLTTKVWHADLDDGPLQKSVARSLKALGVPFVDLLLIHWPNPAIPLRHTFRALKQMHNAGYARHIGISNFPVALVQDSLHIGEVPIVTNQVEYHPWLDQTKLMKQCFAKGISLTAYMPLGRAAVLADPVIGDIATAKGVTPAQVILAWHRRQGIVAVPKTSSPERLKENLDSLNVTLTPDEMTRIGALKRPDGRQLNPAFAPAWDKP
jgi:diketogulonate reductase-like aldo/keto reductase